MRSFFLFLLCCLLSAGAYSQLYFKSTLKANREKMFRNLVQNSINKNLAVPLTDSSEETWQGAFWALELLQYKSLWINGRIDLVAEQMSARSETFQRAALELLYCNYPGKYYDPVKFLLMQTSNPKIFAMCAVYILNSPKAADDINFLAVKTKQQLVAAPENPILQQLLHQLENFQKPFTKPGIESLLSKNYLKGHTIVYSFQRKNRDYPGLVMVRDARGDFIMDSTGLFFSVPQLARSLSNLPGYLSNGNTPEGIFRMKGYDVSTNGFIGPTVNVQLTMPFEKSPAHFYADSSITDTSWNIEYYRNMLPKNLKDYYPVYQSYYAGKAGRTEIIIHGTTINPAYYISQPYYPLTPTAGCLTSKEIWNEDNGQRVESDQQKLIQALIKAGGPQGYAIVINIDDTQRPVALYDIVPLIEKANSQ
jgi:hypothetical protein